MDGSYLDQYPEAQGQQFAQINRIKLKNKKSKNTMTNYYHDIWLSLLFLVVANGWCLYPVLAFSSSAPPPVIFPNSQNAMIRQAAAAISSALLNDALNLQQIRLPLSEAMYGQSEEGFVADRAIGCQ